MIAEGYWPSIKGCGFYIWVVRVRFWWRRRTSWDYIFIPKQQRCIEISDLIISGPTWSGMGPGMWRCAWFAGKSRQRINKITTSCFRWTFPFGNGKRLLLISTRSCHGQHTEWIRYGSSWINWQRAHISFRFRRVSPQRGWLTFTSGRLWHGMGCQFQWLQNGMCGLLLGSGRGFTRIWVLVCFSTWLSTHRLMDRVNVLSRPWRICFRIRISLWRSFRIKTIITLALIDLLLRSSMGGSTWSRYVSVRSFSESWGVRRWY